MPVHPSPPFPGAIAHVLIDLLTPPDPLGSPGSEREHAEESRIAQERAEHERAQRLAAAAVETLGVDAAAVLIVDDAGAPRVWAGTDDDSRALAGLETRARVGPALDCCRAARAAVFEVGAAAGRWHTWSESATRSGWDLAETVPLRARARPVGAMILLSRPGRPRPDDRSRWATVLATATAAGLLHLRALADLQRRLEQLQTALTSRIVIEQAKGVLAERGGLDVQTAFDRMRRYARAHRLRLTDVAQQVVTGEAGDDVLTHVRPDPEPPSILEP
ncbi:MAG TPA: GAF and ANTAR domain-containing protein [Kineosporiaceae bacterium]